MAAATEPWKHRTAAFPQWDGRIPANRKLQMPGVSVSFMPYHGWHRGKQKLVEERWGLKPTPGTRVEAEEFRMLFWSQPQSIRQAKWGCSFRGSLVPQMLSSETTATWSCGRAAFPRTSASAAARG